MAAKCVRVVFKVGDKDGEPVELTVSCSGSGSAAAAATQLEQEVLLQARKRKMAVGALGVYETGKREMQVYAATSSTS